MANGIPLFFFTIISLYVMTKVRFKDLDISLNLTWFFFELAYVSCLIGWILSIININIYGEDAYANINELITDTYNGFIVKLTGDHCLFMSLIYLVFEIFNIKALFTS